MKIVRLEVDYLGLSAETRRPLSLYPWRETSHRVNLFMNNENPTWIALDAVLDCSYSIMMLD